MKTLFLITLIFNCSNIFSTNNNDLCMSKKDFDLMADNKIKKFVRKSGSEQNAIDKLMHICLPDTFFYYDKKKLIWYSNRPMKFVEIDYYASRKLQAYFWIQKIYYSDYITNKKDFYYEFVDESENLIWDYQDLDLDKKIDFYGLEFVLKKSRENFSKQVGYVKNNNDSYKKLENSFQTWYIEMTEKGLQYMRENKIQPPI